MTHISATILAASLAASVAPLWATTGSVGQGPDIEASTQLTMRECLAMQAAKHDGASRAEMRKACQWTTEETRANGMPSGNGPRALYSAASATSPASVTPGPQ
jgi:hypothetical protein